VTNPAQVPQDGTISGDDARHALSPSVLDPDAVRVVRRLTGAGHEAYLVGGCVRDLVLGLRPKDFDVATSATPEQVRREIRNSRIIGRRFRLVHVFFGNKIIETSTFRSAPVTQSDGEDPLILQDNEWGSVEDDARRRDFTINALFYDVEEGRIVDFVDGQHDLQHRVIRTIGDPELRFREDPVRMIRALKYAARLGFEVEPGTWEALVRVAPDIVKSSRARLLEEIYKFLRGSASAGTFALLARSGLLEHLMPSYVEQLAEGGIVIEGRDVPGSVERYLSALDDFHAHTQQIASNGVLVAALLAPLLGERLATAPRRELDHLVEQQMNPVATELGIARRDRDLARQVLMGRHSVGRRTHHQHHAGSALRQYFHDALVFLGLEVAATGAGRELPRWMALADRDHSDDTSAPPPAERSRRRRRRGGRRRGGGGGSSGGGG
jgi:poly(A) polymerase